jgi:hypothetical protein
MVYGVDFDRIKLTIQNADIQYIPVFIGPRDNKMATQIIRIDSKAKTGSVNLQGWKGRQQPR